MRYHRHRDLTLSAVGMGCYAAGGAYGSIDRGQARRAIDCARALGVTFFDTAEAYGDTEALLGEALRAHRQRVVIATKVGVRQGTRPCLRADYITAACEDSLRALATSYIDLYQVHFDDPGTPVAETLAALEMLKASGKIRHYGVGHLPAERVAEYLATGDCFSVMMELSPVERDASRTLLPLCNDHGAGALAFSVTGRGVLSGRIHPDTQFAEDDIRRIDPLFQRERFSSALRIAAKLAELGAERGWTGVQTAIAWVLAQPGVICALTGATSVAHLEENLAAADLDLPGAVRAELDRHLAAEEKRRAGEQRAGIGAILAAPLAADASAAFTGLIYALETAIALGLATEAEIVPLFHELLPLRRNPAESRPQMNALLEKLRALLDPRL